MTMNLNSVNVNYKMLYLWTCYSNLYKRNEKMDGYDIGSTKPILKEFTYEKLSHGI